jgi:UPF0755 protein
MLLGVLLALGGGAGAHHWILRWSTEKVGPAETIRLHIAPGSSSRAIAEQLHAAGLLRHPRFFPYWLRVQPRRAALQAGDYTLKGPLSPTDLLEKLSHGQFGRSVTIPEGWTAQQIARRLVKEGLIANEQVWLDAVVRPVPAELLGEAQPSAEGFCFPDTYRFEPGTSVTLILGAMLRRFAEQWTAAEPARRLDGATSASLRAVVTLASMLEREARIDQEMPLIASVYYNRLAKNMKLQCCATVYYALGLISGSDAWDQPLTRADLKSPSPFNTYQHLGLPPAPIGNPGLPALKAALRPEPSEFLFYVYRGDKRHIFSRTYADHQSAIAKIRERDPQSALVAQ